MPGWPGEAPSCLWAGGSGYYVVAGVLLLAVGLGVARRSAAALWLFALWLLGTALWAVWEIGLDWWPLAGRLGVPWLMGLLLVLPWSVRALRHEPDMGQNGAWHRPMRRWRWWCWARPSCGPVIRAPARCP